MRLPRLSGRWYAYRASRLGDRGRRWARWQRIRATAWLLFPRLNSVERLRRYFGRRRGLTLGAPIFAAQKYTDLSAATATDRISFLQDAAKHLSDGTLVYLDYDGTNFYLRYSSDHASDNAIATLASPFSNSFLLAPNWITLCRDSSDNIYVVGASGTQTSHVLAQAFTKGAGYSWTAQTAFNVVMTDASAVQAFAAVWCNTGGGTNNKGHLMVLADTSAAIGPAWCSLDAGVLLAGSGTLVQFSGRAPTFLPTASTFNGGLDLSTDGFGATSGLAIAPASSAGGTMQLGAWGLSSTGALTTNTSLSTTLAVGGATAAKARLIRYATNAWAVVAPSTTAGRYMVARYSASAQLTALTDSGAPASMPLNAAGPGWDALLDPSAATKIWVYAIAAQAGGNQQVYRLGCSLGSGVAWDAAVTTDDLLTNCFATQTDMRTVKEPTGAYVDWQAFVQTAAGNYALDGDYTLYALAPNAPTLNSPSSGSYQDGTGALTFTGTYNATDNTNQSAVAFRRKIGAGAYTYWRASDTSWQAGAIWNPTNVVPGGQISIAFPAAAFTNGNTYLWSMASQETPASLQGPFAADFTMVAQAAPTVVVNTPTGAQGVSQPQVTWTPTTPGGAVQTIYRVVVFTLAQYSIGGFNWATSPSSWDNGGVAGAGTTQVIGTPLINGATYRAYVIITETGGQISAPAFSGFTVAFDSPAQPLLTGSYDQANARSILNVQAQDNWLSLNQSSLETDLTGWAALANCAILQSAAFAKDGSFSMRMRSTAAGDMSATTPTGAGGIACPPSTVVTAMAQFQAAAQVRSCKVAIFWYKAGGAASSVRASDTSAGFNDAVGAWQATNGASLTVTSPSDAATFAIVVYVLATAGANEDHYVDCIGIGPGTLTTWTRGGLPGVSLALLEYSDDSGATWNPVRFGGSLVVPSPSQVVATQYDYEIAPGATRNYRATISAAGPITSVPSASLPLVNTPTGWWLKDPMNPATNVRLSVPIKYEPVHRVREESTEFHALGRSRPIVVADAVPKLPQPGSLTVQTLNLAAHVLLFALISAQRTLLLQGLSGEQWYIRLMGERPIKGPSPAGVREYALAYVEVDAP